MIEMMEEINQSINPKWIDKSKFFDRVQGEKESNHRYVAEMKHLYVHHEVAKMSHEDILAYLMVKGFASSEVKKEIVKSVEGKSGTISLKEIESTINIMAQCKRFNNFGSNSNHSVNRINFQNRTNRINKINRINNNQGKIPQIINKQILVLWISVPFKAGRK